MHCTALRRRWSAGGRLSSNLSFESWITPSFYCESKYSESDTLFFRKYSIIRNGICAVKNKAHSANLVKRSK
ncbi:hypothetical protein JCM18507_28840 [Fusicatenibacter saccharivorans]